MWFYLLSSNNNKAYHYLFINYGLSPPNSKYLFNHLTMSSQSDISQSHEYLSFRESIPLKNISVDTTSSHSWKIYDTGPKSVNCPLVCLLPVCGSADVYFKQLMGLKAKGYRVISAEQPPYWSVREWCEGFKKLLDTLSLSQVHIFGSSVGGFLAQKFAEYTYNCPRVASLILCNTFTDTTVFSYNDSAAVFWMLPSLVLKKMLLANFPNKPSDKDITGSVDFLVEKLESLTQQDLASRLTLNCTASHVDSARIANIPTTIVDVYDDYALSSKVRDDVCNAYPHAKLAHLKSGGNFPYLSRSEEINLHLEIHLRQFLDTQFCPQASISKETTPS